MSDENALPAPAVEGSTDSAVPPAEPDQVATPAVADTTEASQTSTQKIASPLPQLHTVEKSVENRSAEQSQPMSKVASTTSNHSAKDDSQSDAAGYGTRSRNRGSGQRPNYADDVEYEFETASARKESAPAKRSASFETGSNSRATSEAVRPTAATIKLNASTPSGSLRSNNLSALERSATPSGSEAPSEKKKRKFERTSAAKSASGQDNRTANARDGIPGTAHFLAASSGAADQPPSKKRRTGDDSTATRLSTSQLSRHGPETCVVSFEKSGAVMKDGKLEADDGSVYSPNDNVYLICEPPGDPYYLCRIMEFRPADPENPKSPVVSMLVNWYYRPKDIGRYSSDPRFLYASMQSDESPITSLRGKCHIKHRSELSDVEEYRKQRDTFYFTQLYDRYSHRPYEIIPVSAVINVPNNVKKALDDRWRFLIVEPARQKELTSAVKLCKRCSQYCAPNDSVDCGVCRETYHMQCVRPPLAKKPSRGFAWSCGPCSRAQERKLEERHTAVIKEPGSNKDDEIMEEEEDDPGTQEADVSNDDAAPDHAHEQTEIAKPNVWLWRYLGIHSKVEDVLQLDDRAIYPRASSRLGPRHQAQVVGWFGHAVEFVKPLDLKKRSKKDIKASKETAAALEAEKAERAKRPKWVQDQPAGYIARGEDFDESDPNCTAIPLFIPPAEKETAPGFMAANSASAAKKNDTLIDDYMATVRQRGKDWGMVTISKRGDPQISSNYLDRALYLLYKNNFDSSAALEALETSHSPKVLKNPDFTKEELKRFEDGVAKYGSDLRSVRRYVKGGRTYGEIVRFYYTWKFSQRGSEVWGNQQGRKAAKRRAETSWMDIADDEDDSAFDNEKANAKKRRFHCKFCSSRSSRQWRRAPGVAPGATVLADPKGSAKDKSNQLVLALCQRCAIMWRRYGLRWEDPDEIAKSINSAGGRAWKRKNDEEMLRELVCANEVARVPTSAVAATAAQAIGLTVTVPIDVPRKKLKANGESEGTPGLSSSEQGKKKASAVPKEPTPPPPPMPPKWRDLPCAICRELDVPHDELFSCKECKLTVHRRCYAISDSANPAKWVCDTCLNDKNTLHSLRYECALCPVANRTIELLEPARPTHKKRSDRDRERERIEKEMGQKMEDEYFKEQKQKGRPRYPREALKLTASDNWMHVTCAVWTPDIKFADATKMQNAEGMGAIISSPQRMDPVCQLCKIREGVCVSCHQCHAPFHVACANEHGYTFGFDVSPVKGSRKDQNQIVTLGSETGSMTAAIWCKEHAVKTIVHSVHEELAVSEEGEARMNALEVYVQVYKQADLTLTGTARKANLVTQSNKTSTQSNSTAANRRASTLTNGVSHSGDVVDGHDNHYPEDRRCKTCGIDVSLTWWHASADVMNNETGIWTRQSAWQCHKCHSGAQGSLGPVPPVTEDAIPSKPTAPPPDLFQLISPRLATPWTANGSANVPIERFAQDIPHVTITLTNPTFGGLHVFRGKDFGLDLDSDPTPLFKWITYWAMQKCGYDQERDVIITEDGSWVTFPKSMMQALVKMIISGSREAHWRVMAARDIPCKLMTNVSNYKFADVPLPSASTFKAQPAPPPPAAIYSTPNGAHSFYGHHNYGTPVGGYRQATAPYAYRPGAAPLHNGTGPPGSATGIATAMQSPPVGARAAPYYPQTSPTTSTAPLGNKTSPALSQAAVPTTPKATTLSGASSSPNLKNLMH